MVSQLLGSDLNRTDIQLLHGILSENELNPEIKPKSTTTEEPDTLN
jgi:hypothetical protein